MTQPVFVLAKNLPQEEKTTSYQICIAASKTVGRDGVLGAQLIGSLFRIYLSNAEARVALLSKGLSLEGRTIEVCSQNPFSVRDGSGEEIPSTRLTVSDLPISVSNEALESALSKKGLKLRSKLKMEGIRDPQGKLTEWLSGRRYTWIDLPKASIDPYVMVGQMKAKIYYKELKAERVCRRCTQKGHIARDCTSVQVCFKCGVPGHIAAQCGTVPQKEDTHIRNEHTASGEVTLELSPKQSSEQSLEQSSEQSLEQSSEQSLEQSSEQSLEQRSKQSSEQSLEHSLERSSEEEVTDSDRQELEGEEKTQNENGRTAGPQNIKRDKKSKKSKKGKMNGSPIAPPPNTKEQPKKGKEDDNINKSDENMPGEVARKINDTIRKPKEENRGRKPMRSDITRYLAKARSLSSSSKKRAQPDSPSKEGDSPARKMRGDEGS